MIKGVKQNRSKEGIITLIYKNTSPCWRPVKYPCMYSWLILDCQVIICPCDRAMQFQSTSHISPFLIRVSVAQRLEHPARSGRVVSSNSICNSFCPRMGIGWDLLLERTTDIYVFLSLTMELKGTITLRKKESV